MKREGSIYFAVTIEYRYTRIPTGDKSMFAMDKCRYGIFENVNKMLDEVEKIIKMLKNKGFQFKNNIRIKDYPEAYRPSVVGVKDCVECTIRIDDIPVSGGDAVEKMTDRILFETVSYEAIRVNLLKQIKQEE